VVNLARDIDAVAAGKGSDKDFVAVAVIAIAGVPVSQLCAMGREQADSFELLVAGELTHLSALDVQDLQSGQVAVAEMRVLLSGKGQ